MIQWLFYNSFVAQVHDVLDFFLNPVTSRYHKESICFILCNSSTVVTVSPTARAPPLTHPLLSTSLVSSLPPHVIPLFLSLCFSLTCHHPFLFPVMFPFYLPSLLSLCESSSTHLNPHLASALQWLVNVRALWQAACRCDLVQASS